MTDNALRSIGIELGDDYFQVAGARHSIAAISHVTFAIQQTSETNPALASVRSRLRLSLTGGRSVSVNSPPRSLSSFSKSPVDPVWLFAEIVSDKTFDQRLDNYSKQLSDKRFIQFDSHQIHADGSLFYRAQKIGHLRDGSTRCSLQPTHLHITKGSGVNIDTLTRLRTDVDRDCLLYLLKTHFDIAFPKQRIRERKADRARLLFECITALGAKIAKADGVVSEAEIAAFKDYFNSPDFPVQEFGQTYKRATLDGRSIEEVAAEIVSRHDNPDLLEMVFVGLICIAASDGIIRVSEQEALKGVASAFGIPANIYNHLLAIHAHGARVDGAESKDSRHEREKGEKKFRRDSSNHSQAADRLRVLGLEPSATPDEIKAAFRKISAHFHPDIVRSKGMPEAFVLDAQETLKKVSAAYSWLRSNGYCK